MELVDAVIPTFMETERLLRAVDSAKAQTLKVNKIFVVDDGSSEEIQNWIRTKFLGDSQVEVIQNHHTGLPGVGRGLAVARSEAKWISFLDADDTWSPDKIEKQLSLAKSSKADLVFSNAQIKVDGDNRGAFFTRERFHTSPSLSQMIADNRIVNSSVIVRRDALVEVGGYADSAHVRGVEDYATWLRVSVNHNLVGLDEQLVQFEVSANGVGLSSNPMVRIFALSDFVVWSRGLSNSDSRTFKNARRKALAQILRENK